MDWPWVASLLLPLPYTDRIYQPLPKGGPSLISHHPPAAPPLAASHTPIMLSIPSNALERSSAQVLDLITGYFCWIMSSGIDHQDSFKDVHKNFQFIDIVNADCFSVNWRKCLIYVSNDFDLVMRRFWVNVSFHSLSVFHLNLIISNHNSRSMQVLISGMCLAHLSAMNCVPTLPSSFTLTASSFDMGRTSCLGGLTSRKLDVPIHGRKFAKLETISLRSITGAIRWNESLFFGGGRIIGSRLLGQRTEMLVRRSF